MEQAQIKPKLLDLLNRAHAHQQAFIAELRDDDHAADGVFEQWSVKDHVAHIAAWKQRQTLQIAATVQGETPPAFDDVDHLNRETWETHRARPWAEVLADDQRMHAELMAQVEQLDEAVLAETRRSSGQEGPPLWRSILGNGYWHPMAHITRLYVERGKLGRATEIQEALAHTATELDDSPRSRSVGLYNLACFYAMTGQPVKALAILPEALRLNPELVEWSQQDPDLEPLRADARFQALPSAERD